MVHLHLHLLGISARQQRPDFRLRISFTGWVCGYTGLEFDSSVYAQNTKKNGQQLKNILLQTFTSVKMIGVQSMVRKNIIVTKGSICTRGTVNTVYTASIGDSGECEIKYDHI